MKKLVIDRANRVHQLPPSIHAFTVADTGRRKLLRKSETLDLASFTWPVAAEEYLPHEGSLLEPAPSALVDKLKATLAEWLNEQYNTANITGRNIFIGGRISQLVFQMALTYIDPGDVAFVPGLALPLYRSAVTACNGESVGYAISARAGWRPQFARLQTRLGRVARLLFVNSPHNPTGAQLDEKNMTELAWLAARENILLVNDAAYAGIPERPPVSLLSVRGGKKVGLELYSFSYLLGLPDWPIGFAVGNREVIGGLDRTSSLLRTDLTQFHVAEVIRALRQYPSQQITQIRRSFADTAAATSRLFSALRLERAGMDSVPFVWAKLERRSLSVSTARRLQKRYRILTVPGSAFGENGEGYLRFSLTTSPDTYSLAAKRISQRVELRRKGSK